MATRTLAATRPSVRLVLQLGERGGDRDLKASISIQSQLLNELGDFLGRNVGQRCAISGKTDAFYAQGVAISETAARVQGVEDVDDKVGRPVGGARRGA